MQKMTCVGERGNAREERRAGRKMDSEGTMELLNEIPCVLRVGTVQSCLVYACMDEASAGFLPLVLQNQQS